MNRRVNAIKVSADFNGIPHQDVADNLDSGSPGNIYLEAIPVCEAARKNWDETLNDCPPPVDYSFLIMIELRASKLPCQHHVDR